MIKKSEIILFSTIVAGGILRQINIKGSSFIGGFSFCCLASFYLFFGFLILNDLSPKRIFRKSEYKDVKPYKLILAFIISLAYIFITFGIFAILNSWGTYHALRGFLWSGILVISIIFAISLLFSIFKSSKFSLGVLLRSSIFLLVAIGILIFV